MPNEYPQPPAELDDEPSGMKITPYRPWELNFRSQMQRRRAVLGMSQTDLARRLKKHGLAFHQQTVQRIEAGERPIRLDEAYVIADVLETPMEWMLSSFGGESAEFIDSLARFVNTSTALSADMSDWWNDWWERADDLVTSFENLLSLHPEGSTREIRWAAAWIIKARWLAATYNQVEKYSQGIVMKGTTLSWRDDGIAIESSLDHFDWLENPDEPRWAGLGMDDLPPNLADLDPVRLNEYLFRDGGEDGEHQEAQTP